MPTNPPDPFNPAPARFIGAIFGFAFCGIGLTVLGFLWLTPFDEFGSPPIFFRIFGSFIAIIFVAVGGTAGYGAVFAKSNPFSPTARLQSFAAAMRSTSDRPAASSSYTCPHCAAPLQSKADVSPSGDAKCTFCNAWFNIHQQKA